MFPRNFRFNSAGAVAVQLASEAPESTAISPFAGMQVSTASAVCNLRGMPVAFASLLRLSAKQSQPKLTEVIVMVDKRGLQRGQPHLVGLSFVDSLLEELSPLEECMSGEVSAASDATKEMSFQLCSR